MNRRSKIGYLAAGVAVNGEGWSWFFEGLHGVRRGPNPDTIDRLLRARARIERDYGGSLDLDALAREACYSRYHFLRLFEQHYGQTPGRFLQQRRLREAARLLRETEQSVTDVSFAVGFHSPGTFSRTFRDQIGMAPVQYRRSVFPGVSVRVQRVPGCFLHLFGRIAIPEKRANAQQG